MTATATTIYDLMKENVRPIELTEELLTATLAFEDEMFRALPGMPQEIIDALPAIGSEAEISICESLVHRWNEVTYNQSDLTRMRSAFAYRAAQEKNNG